MIGSPQAYYHIYADTDAHKSGGQILVDYLLEKGYPAEYGYVNTSSGYLHILAISLTQRTA
jgi:aminopeptidase Y